MLLATREMRSASGSSMALRSTCRDRDGAAAYSQVNLHLNRGRASFDDRQFDIAGRTAARDCARPDRRFNPPDLAISLIAVDRYDDVDAAPKNSSTKTSKAAQK